MEFDDVVPIPTSDSLNLFSSIVVIQYWILVERPEIEVFVFEYKIISPFSKPWCLA